MKKLFLIATPILLFAIPISQFVYNDVNVAIILSMLFLLFNLGYMYSLGTFRHTALGRISYIAFPIIIVGALFKLQHWPYGSELFLVGMASIILTYPIYFIMKKQKKLLDWLKVFTIVIAAIAAMSRTSSSPPYIGVLVLFSILILIALIVVFYVRVWKGKEDKKHKDSIAASGNDVFNYKD